MAESALRGGLAECKATVAMYKKNAKTIMKKFDELGIEYTGGVNAPYIWFNCGVDSWAFFDYMLKKARLVCTPGSGFGQNGKIDFVQLRGAHGGGNQTLRAVLEGV